MEPLVPIRYDQTDLAGRVAMLLTGPAVDDDVGVHAELPLGTTHVVIVDDTPNPDLTLRVHPVGDNRAVTHLDHAELALVPGGGEHEATDGIASFTEVGLAETASVRADDDRLRAEAGRLIEPIVQDVALLGPPGWVRFSALFAVAGPAELARITFDVGAEAVPVRVPAQVMARVREHRTLAAGMSAGPWWRMRLDVDRDGRVAERFDYGDEPFPADQLFAPNDYRRDLQALPRPRVPVWLAGYIAGPAAQGRTPDQAAAGDAVGTAAVPTGDLVPLDEVWARWAVAAAVRAGLRRPIGAWIGPATATFEDGDGNGSTLCVLPRDRSVLSGGRWNSPLLDGAYNGGGALPALYDGAPAWVTDAVLDGRGQRGALSFCYWWHDGQWHRGGTDTFDELDDPLPPIWTDGETIDAVVREVGEDRRQAVTRLVAAVGARTVTRDDLAAALPTTDIDLDAAYEQLTLAGLAP